MLYLAIFYKYEFIFLYHFPSKTGTHFLEGRPWCSQIGENETIWRKYKVAIVISFINSLSFFCFMSIVDYNNNNKNKDIINQSTFVWTKKEK